MKRLLLPVAWIYGSVVAVRNWAFDAGILQQRRADVPVISVGNMTAGGTGKTPLVEYIVGYLLCRGRRVGVVSRGFGRRSHGVVIVACGGKVLVDAVQGGDEPVQIARKFPAASVVVGERRADAARVAIRECGADVIVLDDGFQHRSLDRNLDIVVLDARKDIGGEMLLPAGMRREWLAGLRRAHMLGFSRADRGAIPAWGERWARECGGRTFAFRASATGFFSIAGERVDQVRGPVLAFSGIGDHDGFVKTLREAGVLVAGDVRFADHHWMAEGDVAAILARAEKCGARMLMTTEKDAVRLSADPQLAEKIVRAMPILWASLTVDVPAGRETLEAEIDRCLAGGVRQ